MPIPIILEDIFDVNLDSKITFHENFIQIDNFYKNINKIQQIFETMYVESWKFNDFSRNFKDYYDCRPIFANWHPSKKIKSRLNPLSSLLSKVYPSKIIDIEQSFQFNVFKHIKKDVPQFIQHHPHYDDNMVNILVYIDKVANGGTNLYKKSDIVNREGSTLLIDVSNFEVLETIEAKPNRCVIFDGNHLHGAYIQDNNKYFHNWRITQSTIISIL